jgi:hypothetical protein
MDELHLTVRAPQGLPEPEYGVIHQALKDRRFLGQLRRAVRTVFRRQPALEKVKVTLSR